MTTPPDPTVTATPTATYPPDCPLPPRPAVWGTIYPFYSTGLHRWLWVCCYYDTEELARTAAIRHSRRKQLPVAVVYIPPEEPTCPADPPRK